MIIGRLVSLHRNRLGARAGPGLASPIAATLGALLACTWACLPVVASTLAPSKWVALSSLPRQGTNAILAVAVSPSNNQVLLVGTAEGSLLRSADGGSTWKGVHSGSGRLLTIAFSPFKSGLVLAGTSKSALASQDGGVTWGAVKGVEGRSVRVFGFALALVAAGTDQGVYVSADGLTWRQSGLSGTSIGALAVAAIHDPVRLVAGSGSATGGTPPLFQSTDAGTTWAQTRPAISGKYVTSMTAGPLPPTGNVRPLILGTNAGLFTSRDNGASFIPNSGGGLLPSIDYTQVVFVTTHFDRYYTASDGGGSVGGLWKTGDGGRSFTSLAPPVQSVTALAVSNDEAPILYVATLRPGDQVPALWAYRDTGGSPQGPPGTVTPSTSGSRTTTAAGLSGLSQFLRSSRTPYILLGLVAAIVIGLAVVSHIRGRRG